MKKKTRAKKMKQNATCVIVITGPTETMMQFNHNHNTTERFSASQLLEEHQLRNQHSVALDYHIADEADVDPDLDHEGYSEFLLHEYNWGLHPSSFLEGGFALQNYFEMPADKATELMREMSELYPDLYFDLTFVWEDKKEEELHAGFVLYQNGHYKLIGGVHDIRAFYKAYEAVGESVCEHIIEDWKSDEIRASYMHFLAGFTKVKVPPAAQVQEEAA